ncbi:MAG: rhomboid family intramembrane serine protease [Bacteroidetes bacterium]|nr:rhomboid family intramembrane serine protease [Bacteroidota bacterium]
MPKHQQQETVSGMDKETILATALEAFKKLGWSDIYAGDEKLATRTPQKWNKYSMQILLTAGDGQYEISSEMIHGESFDMMGRNKKNTDAFTAAFNQCKSTMTAAELDANKAMLAGLREKTTRQVELDNKEAAEVDEVMHQSTGNMYLTYGIIAVNIIVFVLMALDGAGVFEADGLTQIKWGSNYTPLTLGGDWWRLITNTFIHFGIIHIAMNMYALFMVGVYLEPMLGKVKFGTAYLCTGVLASVASLWWHKEGVNAAGASGAIFGMFGVFLALLTSNLIPNKVRQSLLTNIAIYVGYNIFYGLSHKGIDNSAHIGGLISGFIIGYIYVMAIKKEKQEIKTTWALPAVVLLTIAGAYGYLNANKVSAKEKNAVMIDLKNSSYKDANQFNAVIDDIFKLENNALAPLEDTTLTTEERKEKIISVSYPSWNEAETKLHTIANMDVSDNMHKKADKLLQYVQLRKDELDVRIKYIDKADSPEFIQESNTITDKINAVVEALKALQQ